MDGYGNDQTSSNSDGSDGSMSVAQSIAQIFSTGVTAYVDSQAIQRGYQINDPRYFQAGYPAGVSTPYGYQPQGASVAIKSSSDSLLLLIVLGVIAVAVLK